MKIQLRILILLFVTMIFGIIMQFQRLGYLDTNAEKYFSSESSVVKTDKLEQAIKNNHYDKDNVLIIYDSKDKTGMQYSNNVKKYLTYMKVPNEQADCTEVSNIDFSKYTVIINMISNFENNSGSYINKIIDSVKNGTDFIFGITPSNVSDDFNSIYNQFGIKKIKGFSEIDGIKFEKDIIPGTKGRELIDKDVFSDYCLNVELDKESTVYMSSAGSNNGIPLMWQRKLGKGNVIFYNKGDLGGNYSGGIFAGVFSILKGNFVYPIINAKVVFIDDFPAPQYNDDSSIVTTEYKKSVKDFYRDIWWPDLQKAAKKYNLIYTGLFICTYNNTVDPSKFTFEDDPMMQYYGNSLLKNNFEIGLHGYNHQSLVMKGQIPKELGYVPWKSQEDMEVAVKTLNGHAEEMFPGCIFKSYVPPSNYLSKEGRKALRKALPNLKVISGVYTESKEQWGAYVQDYKIADDGIAEFPRMTSGMWKDNDTEFQYLNGIGLYGVFSHFIHPDDILDSIRGRGKGWDEMFKSYCGILDDVESNYSFIRPMKAYDTANALEVYEKLKIGIKYNNDSIKGYCDNFCGQSFFYLRTEKNPKAADESCQISRIGSDGDYYIVTVNKPVFNIKLN